MFATKAVLKPHAQFTAAYSFVNNDSENKKLDNNALQQRADIAIQDKELVRVEVPCMVASEGVGVPGVYHGKQLMATVTRFDVSGATTSGNLA